MSDAKYTKPELRKRIVARIKAGSKGGAPGQWSARKAQLARSKLMKKQVVVTKVVKERNKSH